MASVDYLDSADAMHALVVLKAFGLTRSYANGRECPMGDGEAPVMVWTVHAPELIDPIPPERDEAHDYIESHWDREEFDRDYLANRRRRIANE